MKKIISILIILLTFVIFSSLVGAFGVASPYWDTKPLSLTPGETKTFELSVQNYVGNSNITFKVELTSGEEVVDTPEGIYFLPAHSAKAHPVTVTMPSDATHGESYYVGLRFREVINLSGGGIGIGRGYGIGFPVVAYAPDQDNDGFWDGNDCAPLNPEINPGAIELPGNNIDENCDGEIVCDSSENWKNHGKFVSCVAREAEELVGAGLITEEEKDLIVSEAAQSGVGKKK